MNFSIVDNLIHYFFDKKWKIKEEFTPHTYKLPKTLRVKKDENNDLFIFKFPSHYQHYKYITDYNFGFCAYIAVFNLFQVFASIKLYKKTKIKKIFIFTAGYTVFSYFEMMFIYSRVRDVKEVLLHNGTKLRVKTWNDDVTHVVDVKDVRVIMNNEVLLFLDASRKENMFYVMEPSFANMINSSDVFDLIFKDRRYLTYDI